MLGLYHEYGHWKAEHLELGWQMWGTAVCWPTASEALAHIYAMGKVEDPIEAMGGLIALTRLLEPKRGIREYANDQILHWEQDFYFLDAKTAKVFPSAIRGFKYFRPEVRQKIVKAAKRLAKELEAHQI